MARKKIVFVIVEGPSDDTALGVLLSKIYDKDTVYVHIVNTDNLVHVTRSFSAYFPAIECILSAA